VLSSEPRKKTCSVLASFLLFKSKVSTAKQRKNGALSDAEGRVPVREETPAVLPPSQFTDRGTKPSFL